MKEKTCTNPQSREAIKIHGGRYVERYSFLERLAHFSHLIALFILLVTGFRIYAGWTFMSYHIAYYIHMIAAIIFMIANWIIIPYNILTTECPHCEACATGGHNIYIHRAAHIVRRYIFGPTDAKRVKQILLNYMGKAPYPAYSVYDVKNRGYIDKLHPITKLLLFFEGLAVFLVFLTGIVLYDLQWTFLGFPLSQWLLSVGDMLGPLANMSTISFMKTVHLMMAYFFIIEVAIHVGIVEFDPKVWKYHKAIFWTGKGDLCNLDYVELVNVENDKKR